MKLRIIKEESVYRIQEFAEFATTSGGEWIYAHKATHKQSWWRPSLPIDFTKKEAEDFIEHNYIVKVVKEYEVE